MGKESSIFILEDSAFFKKGQVINEYERTEDGILVEQQLIPESNYVVLNEQLSFEDEKKVKELIRKQLKYLFWNLYNKQSILVGNL